MSAGGVCVFCGKRVDPKKDYRLVEGWERSRTGGGTNALRLRKPTDKWACASCIDKESRGISVRQESLL